MTYKQMIDCRYEYNQRILDVIKLYIEKYPQLRFGQILFALNIITTDNNNHLKDIFNDESVEIFNRIKNDLPD